MEKDDRRNGPILTKVESTQIFGNVEEIYHLHSAIAEQLDQALNDDECIGSVFLANVNLIIYKEYKIFEFSIFSLLNFYVFINHIQNFMIKQSKQFIHLKKRIHVFMLILKYLFVR
jgi:hypothetical protein